MRASPVGFQIGFVGSLPQRGHHSRDGVAQISVVKLPFDRFQGPASPLGRFFHIIQADSGNYTASRNERSDLSPHIGVDDMGNSCESQDAGYSHQSHDEGVAAK